AIVGSRVQCQEAAPILVAQDQEVDQAPMESRAVVVDLTIVEEAELPGDEAKGKCGAEDVDP
ncbi:hypothetical protein U1Q18_047109, partial [Sarracenia purpurea var. burkii]